MGIRGSICIYKLNIVVIHLIKSQIYSWSLFCGAVVGNNVNEHIERRCLLSSSIGRYNGYVSTIYSAFTCQRRPQMER